MADHLAILAPEPLAEILGGRKTVESRLARDRRPPWGRVAPGDRIWLKRAGGPVMAVARAAWVRFWLLASEEEREALWATPGLCPTAAYRQAKQQARYATLIGLTALTPLAPFPLLLRGRAAWRLLGKDLSHQLEQQASPAPT
ncbi:MAG: ASCH domain-containing protein [Chloroflexi bacterium]|nr:ASCH domain-containing protein [Chloroflexota bacterium]